MRMILVAGLLMVALLCAVLGSVGATSPVWVSARDGAGVTRVPSTHAPAVQHAPLAPG